MKRFEPLAFLRDVVTRWDVLAFIVVIGLVVFLGETSRGLFAPLTPLQLIADLAGSLAFAGICRAHDLPHVRGSRAVAALHADIRHLGGEERAGRQIAGAHSGYPAIGAYFRFHFHYSRVLHVARARDGCSGAEFAAIFAIFTSQAWNMAFSFYQSLRTIPIELAEAAESFRLSPWMRFWQLEVPFAMPALIWNMMMSMSGGWFFVVASESISVGHTTVALPGVGSYIALAIEQKNLAAIGWAIATMLIVILLYDQLIFRPLVAWVDRFRVEQEPGARVPDSWALTMMRRSRLIQAATLFFHSAVMLTSRAIKRRDDRTHRSRSRASPNDRSICCGCR